MKIPFNLLQRGCCYNIIASLTGFANLEEAYTLFDLMKKLKLRREERERVDAILSDSREYDTEPFFGVCDLDLELPEIKMLESRLMSNASKLHPSDVQWVRPLMRELTKAQDSIASGKL